jgi:arylsulfatase A-like enzyme
LEENTLVIFISDNGAETFGHNGGLNGDKGGLLEGGHRVPAIVYWKNKIDPGVSSETLISMDLLPTILSISQGEAPSAIDFDGMDFSKILFEEPHLEERTLFWKYREQKAARKNQWKLLITETDTALYNLEKDLKETTNLADSHTAIVEELIRQLKNWENEVTQNVEMKTL